MSNGSPDCIVDSDVGGGLTTATGIPVDTTMDGLEKIVAAAEMVASELAEAGIPGRARLLESLADSLDSEVESLVDTADAETSLGRPRLTGEVARTSGQLRMFARVLREGSYVGATIDHRNPDARPVPVPDLRRYLVPIGPVAVFSASNFPFAFSVGGGDTASALAAGCPVVVKAHEGHPETSRLTAAALQRAAGSVGFSAEVVQVVGGRAIGVDLVRHPAIRAASFTGSITGGRALFDVAVSRPDPIPFYGELGSLNAVVVTPSAAAARSVAIGEGLAQSFTMGAGQFCTKPGLVLVPGGQDGRKMVDALIAVAKKVPAHRLLMARMLDGYRAQVESLGATPYVGTLLDGSNESAHAVTPTVLSAAGIDVLADGANSPILEECFGPTTVLVTYDSSDELLALLRLVPPGLTGTVHGEPDDPVAESALRALTRRVGRVVWNGFPTGVAPTWAMHHGGGYPASTVASATSVGSEAITRFLSAVAFQEVPDALLPLELQEANPLGIVRRLDGRLVS